MGEIIICEFCFWLFADDEYNGYIFYYLCAS